jgi:hypothetical protein
MNQKITFKAEDLKYPTDEELRYADSQCPKFTNFGFQRQSAIKSIFDRKPVQDASIDENLFWWDLVLKNRFGSLRGAYYESLTHFRRGFKDDYKECTENEILNRLLFDSNAEVFYYFFFVTTDVIAQILNLYFSLKILETKVNFNEDLINIISEPYIKRTLQEFYDETKTARYYRNGFTHRFPTNYPDYRSKTELIE